MDRGFHLPDNELFFRVILFHVPIVVCMRRLGNHVGQNLQLGPLQRTLGAMSDSQNIAGIILAAGIGQRLEMGPKAFVEINGETLLNRAIKTLRGAGVSDIIAVLPPSKLGPNAVKWTNNMRPESGPLGSVLAGIKKLEGTAPLTFVYPVDHALVQIESLVTLITTARSKLPDDASFLSPTWRDKAGHPILLLPKTIQLLRDYALQPGDTLRTALNAIGPPYSVPVLSEGILHNINNRGDFDRAEKQLRDGVTD